MAKWKAATEIQHGKATDEEPAVTVIAEGDDVDQAAFSEDEWAALVEAGAVVDEDAKEEDLPLNQSVTEVVGETPKAPEEAAPKAAAAKAK